jgi:hypothetical protein
LVNVPKSINPASGRHGDHRDEIVRLEAQIDELLRQGDATRDFDVGRPESRRCQAGLCRRAYGEVFGTQDGGESWREMPLPQGVQHIYALACG